MLNCCNMKKLSLILKLKVAMLNEQIWHTRGVQKVRSLIQLTTEYEHDILSLFNIVLFNRNALSPVILQVPYSIVEEFWFLVLQPVTCGADNIIIVSKFPSFHEFIQCRKQIKSLGAKSGPNLANTVGGGAVQSLHFGWQSVVMMTSALSWWNNTLRHNFPEFHRLLPSSVVWHFPIKSV